MNNQDNENGFSLANALAIAALSGGLYKGASTLYKDYKAAGGNISNVFTGRKSTLKPNITQTTPKYNSDILDLNTRLTFYHSIEDRYMSGTLHEAIQNSPDIFQYALAQAKLHANYLVGSNNNNFLNIYETITQQNLDYSNFPKTLMQLRKSGILDPRTEKILTSTLPQHYRFGERFESIVALPKITSASSVVSNKTLLLQKNADEVIGGVVDSFQDALSRHGIEITSRRVRSKVKDRLVQDIDQIIFNNLGGGERYDINIPRSSILPLKGLPPEVNVKKGYKYWLQDAESGLWFHKSGKVATSSRLGGPGRFAKNTTDVTYNMLLNRIKRFNQGRKGVLMHGHYYALGEFLMPTASGVRALSPDIALYQHLTNTLQSIPTGTSHVSIAERLQQEITKIVTSGELIASEYLNPLYRNEAANLSRRVAEQRVTALGFMKRGRGGRFEFDYDAAEQALLNYADPTNPQGLFFHGSAGKIHRLTASRLNAAGFTIFGEGQPIARGLGTELVRPYSTLPETLGILSGDLPHTNTSYFKRGEDFLATEAGRRFWKQSGVAPIQSIAMYLTNEGQMTKYGTPLIQTLAPDGSALGIGGSEFVKAHSGFSTTDIKLFAPEGSVINPRINELLQSGQQVNIPLEQFGESLGYDIQGNIVTGPRPAADTKNFVTGVSRIGDTNELRVHVRQEFTPTVSMKLFPSKMNIAMRQQHVLQSDIGELTTVNTAKNIMDTISATGAEIFGSSDLLKTRSALLHQMTTAYFLELDRNLASNTSRNLKLLRNAKTIASQFAKSANPEHEIIRNAIEHLPARSVGLIGAVAYAEGHIDDALIRSLAQGQSADDIIQELRRGQAIGLVTGRVGDYNITAGSGVRASLEPRNIISALHSVQNQDIAEGLPQMLRELLEAPQETTDALTKSLKSLAGKAVPEATDTVISYNQARNIFRDTSSLGEFLLKNKTGFWVNMEGTHAAGLLGGSSNLFIPGGDIPGMDVLATASSKHGIIAENLAATYRNFIIHHASSKTVEEFKNGFNAFQQSIYDELIYSIYGLSEGRRAGALRGKVIGSRYLQALPHSIGEYHTTLRPGSTGIARDSFLERIREMRAKGGKFALAANQLESMARAGKEIPLPIGRDPVTSTHNLQMRYMKVLWDTPENAHFMTYNPMIGRVTITPTNPAGTQAIAPSIVSNELTDIGAAAGLMGDFDNDHFKFLLPPSQESLITAEKLAKRQLISDTYMRFVMSTQALKKMSRARASSISVEEVRMRRMRNDVIHPSIWQNAVLEDIHSAAIVKRKTGLLSSTLQKQKAMFLRYADEDMWTRAGLHEALWHHIEQETISSKKGLYRTKNNVMMADAIMKHIRDNNFQGLLSTLEDFTGIQGPTTLRYDFSPTEELFQELTRGLSPAEVEKVRNSFSGNIDFNLKQLVNDVETLYNRSQQSPFMTVGNTGSDTLVPSAKQLRDLGIEIGDDANLAERALARLSYERADNPLLTAADTLRDPGLSPKRSAWHSLNNEVNKVRQALHGSAGKWVLGGLVVGGIFAAKAIQPTTDLIPEPSTYGMHNTLNIPNGFNNPSGHDVNNINVQTSATPTKKGYINAGVNGQNIKVEIKGQETIPPEVVAERLGRSVGKTKIDIRVVEDKRGLTPERIDSAYHRDSYMES